MMTLYTLKPQIVSQFTRFRILLWFAEDGSGPPKPAGLGLYHVYVFVFASCRSCEVNYISLLGVNNLQITL
jgi:hypothetical protein